MTKPSSETAFWLGPVTRTLPSSVIRSRGQLSSRATQIARSRADSAASSWSSMAARVLSSSSCARLVAGRWATGGRTSSPSYRRLRSARARAIRSRTFASMSRGSSHEGLSGRGPSCTAKPASSSQGSVARSGRMNCPAFRIVPPDRSRPTRNSPHLPRDAADCGSDLRAQRRPEPHRQPVRLEDRPHLRPGAVERQERLPVGERAPLALYLQRDDPHAAADDDLVVGDPVGAERVVAAVEQVDSGAAVARAHRVLKELRGRRHAQLAELHLRPRVRVEKPVHGLERRVGGGAVVVEVRAAVRAWSRGVDVDVVVEPVVGIGLAHGGRCRVGRRAVHPLGDRGVRAAHPHDGFGPMSGPW